VARDTDAMTFVDDKAERAMVIVRDLAACDPIVHHEVDYGQSDAYTCGACNVEIVGDAAYHYLGDPIGFPHAEPCPWRRAKELQP